MSGLPLNISGALSFLAIRSIVDSCRTNETVDEEAPKHKKESELLVNHEEQSQHNVSTYSLEIGIMVHSVIIGLCSFLDSWSYCNIGVSLGVASEEFVSLLIALCFHQFFEGLGLGAMIARVNFKYCGLAYLNGLAFALTTPVGVAIGIGIQYSVPSPTGR